MAIWTVIRTWRGEAETEGEAINAAAAPDGPQHTVRVLRGDIPDELDALYQIIDTLWGELPVDEVVALVEHAPEIVEACKIVHELVGHE